MLLSERGLDDMRLLTIGFFETNTWINYKETEYGYHAASSNFVKYEKGTSRVIPVIRLTPIQQPQQEA